jgi:hypothetical protein
LKHTAQRITKILDGRERTAKPLLKPAVAAVAVFGAVSFVATQHTPQLVSFQNAASVRTASADKFDYVANADAPRVKAFAASLQLPGASAATPSKVQVPASQKRKVERAKQQVNREPAAEQVEEARELRPAKAPAVVNASMSDEGIPSFVYLVTQTEQYDAFGNVTVTTSVWRIRVMKPSPVQASSPVLPHQT